VRQPLAEFGSGSSDILYQRWLGYGFKSSSV